MHLANIYWALILCPVIFPLLKNLELATLTAFGKVKFTDHLESLWKMPVTSDSMGVGGEMCTFNIYAGQFLWMAKLENLGLQILIQIPK